MKKMILALSVLLITACSSTTTDVRQEHLLACESYTAALEKVAAWKDLGKFNEEQLVLLRRVEATTTPQCQGATPSVAGADLVRQSTQALEDLLLAIIIEGNA